ncbi:hypothetical protein ACWCQQ_41565 [Streptomyces sp. NPDC002143]
MTRTTPPRPLDVEALFPELAAYRGTTTRLHPRPGNPDVSASSVGGPMLWPEAEPWPMCGETHGRGRRIADIRQERRILAAAWADGRFTGLTPEQRELLDELGRSHRNPEARESDSLPMVGLAQLYRRDVSDLSPGPDGCDLLQVFWCLFDAHGAGRFDILLHLRWRRSAEVGEVLAYPFAGRLPEELCARIDGWEEVLEAEAGQGEDAERAGPVGYQYDLSIPPGWRVGGFASWHTTDPYPMDCLTCAAPMELLLTIDGSEWDGGSGSWKPLEDRGLRPHPFAIPTGIRVGRDGELNVFACPASPEHPHRWSLQ